MKFLGDCKRMIGHRSISLTVWTDCCEQHGKSIVRVEFLLNMVSTVVYGSMHVRNCLARAGLESIVLREDRDDCL